MTTLPELARTLGLNDFLRAVDSVGLREELARGNVTVFAPADGSFAPNSGVLSASSGFVLQQVSGSECEGRREKTGSLEMA